MIESENFLVIKLCVGVQGGGRSARVIMLAGAALAGARLVMRGGRRLRSLLLRNPRHVDQLAERLATLEQRVEALVALTAEVRGKFGEGGSHCVPNLFITATAKRGVIARIDCRCHVFSNK